MSNLDQFKNYTTSYEFRAKVEAILTKMNLGEWLDVVIGCYKRVADGKILIDQVVADLQENISFGFSPASLLAYKIKNEVIQQYMNDLTVAADEFYKARTEFNSKFDFKTTFEDIYKTNNLSLSESQKQDLSVMLAKYLLDEKSRTEVLDVMTKSAGVRGFGVSEPVALEVFRQIDVINEKSQKFDAEDVVVKNCYNYLSDLGFKHEEILSKTLKEFEEIKTKWEETKKSAGLTVDSDTTSAPLPKVEDLSFDKLMEDITKDIK